MQRIQGGETKTIKGLNHLFATKQNKTKQSRALPLYERGEVSPIYRSCFLVGTPFGTTGEVKSVQKHAIAGSSKNNVRTLHVQLFYTNSHGLKSKHKRCVMLMLSDRESKILHGVDRRRTTGITFYHECRVKRRSIQHSTLRLDDRVPWILYCYSTSTE